MHYNPEELKSVLSYMKEKHKISRGISFCNGIKYGIDIALKSEQNAFELKAKAIADKEKYIARMDALKKAIEPNLKQYGRQMRFAYRKEVDGNKV